jgi:hypothetical protein
MLFPLVLAFLLLAVGVEGQQDITVPYTDPQVM